MKYVTIESSENTIVEVVIHSSSTYAVNWAAKRAMAYYPEKDEPYVKETIQANGIIYVGEWNILIEEAIENK